jgi:outer membrane protein OmpA-like peptidoglycan-associated protein
VVGTLLTAIVFICLASSCDRKVFLIIGTITPPSPAELIAWTESKRPDIVLTSKSDLVHVLRVERRFGLIAPSRLGHEPNIRYVYEVTSLDQQGISTRPRKELTTEERLEVNAVGATEGTVAVFPLTIPTPLFLLDELTHSDPLDIPLVRSLNLGDTQLKVIGVSKPGTKGSLAEIEVKDSNGIKGVMAIPTDSQSLVAEIAINGAFISLAAAGVAPVAVHRDQDSLPPDANPKGWPLRTEAHVIRELGSAPESGGVSATPKEQRSQSAISVGLWLTKKALEQIECCAVPKDSIVGSSDDSTATNLLSRMQSHFKDMNASFAGAPNHSFEVDFLRTGVALEDSQDAFSTLHGVCSDSGRRRTPAIQIQHDTVVNDLDVKVLVVWNLCITRERQSSSPNSCSGDDLETKLCPVGGAGSEHPDASTAYCGLAADIAATDPSRAIAVVDASCLLVGVAYHEVGHILGGQHGDAGFPDALVGPDDARAYVDADSSLIEPYMSLMATARECPKAKCNILPAWSSGASGNQVQMQVANSTTPIMRPLGDQRHDNKSTILRNYPVVQGFADRRRNACTDWAKSLGFIVPFAFNSPIVRKNGTLTNVRLDPASISKQVSEFSAQLDEYLVQCPVPYLTLTGFTDDKKGPNDTYNETLGAARATLIHTVLLNSLRSDTALSCDPQTMGAEKPRSSNLTASGRADNRRVEVRVGLEKCR